MVTGEINLFPWARLPQVMNHHHWSNCFKLVKSGPCVPEWWTVQLVCGKCSAASREGFVLPGVTPCPVVGIFACEICGIAPPRGPWANFCAWELWHGSRPLAVRGGAASSQLWGMRGVPPALSVCSGKVSACVLSSEQCCVCWSPVIYVCNPSC